MRLRTYEQEERLTWSVKTWQRMIFVTSTLCEEEHDPKVISRRWTAFIKALKRWYFPDLRTIRVLQEHPGGHGWHIHALLDRFIPAEIMLKIADECGLGRMDFRKVSGEDRQKRIGYIVRYISRDMKNRWKNPALKGVRLLTASGSLQAAKQDKSKRWWVRLCDLTIVDFGELSRRVFQAMLEVRHAGSCVFKTWRRRTIPLRMFDLLCIATPSDIHDWQKECAARRPAWDALMA